jgi:two-component system chemotaxis response regulator CheY
MKMPHMDGLDLIEFMKSVPALADIPVGTVTAETDPKFLSESLAAGVSMFLPKPFTPDQVRFMFRALMGKRAPLVQYSGLREVAA